MRSRRPLPLVLADHARYLRAMTALDDATVARIRNEPLRIQSEGRYFTVRASDAREGLLQAELEVVDDTDQVIGYITPFGSNERGAAKAAFFGLGVPALFRSLEDALAEILR
jgi:hypothetical protein